MASARKDFDLELVLLAFQRCTRLDGSLVLDQYLEAFHELCRFFKLTGKLFGFVAKDLESKISMLETRMTSERRDDYRTMQSMITYEKKQNITGLRGSLPSGSRTLLRLHRALEFIIAFISRLSQSDDDAKTSRIASEVYRQTLAKHHPWLVRRMALLAVYVLPSRIQLIQTLCKQDNESVLVLMERVTVAAQAVYDQVQEYYTDNNLLAIP